VAKKYVYYFGDGKAEGTGNMKELLGGKGAGLAEMTNLKVSVPPGFTISTEACVEYYKRGKAYPPGMMDEALHALKRIERSMKAGFGDPDNPLLVSVRSGARASMPGHDGYRAERRLDDSRPSHGLAAQDEERAVCAGQLPPFHHACSAVSSWACRASISKRS
jgi:phosphoenolpyruvate synthase/pyruvate phosphate dikinase